MKEQAVTVGDYPVRAWFHAPITIGSNMAHGPQRGDLMDQWTTPQRYIEVGFTIPETRTPRSLAPRAGATP